MASTDERVLDQLAKPQRTVGKVLDDRWPEIRENCPDRNGSICEITGDTCTWRGCPKLAGRGAKEAIVMFRDSFSFKVVEDSSRESSFQLSRPRQEDTSQAEKTLKRESGEGEGGVRTSRRLQDRVDAPCMALTREGTPCKNPASWALGICGLETLVCGTHRRMVEEREDEINSIEDLEDLGFYLKRREESAYRPDYSGKKRGDERWIRFG